MSKQEKFQTALTRAGKEGIEKEQLKKQMHITDSAVYSMANTLRKRGIDIRNENGRYYMNGPSNLPAQIPNSIEIEPSRKFVQAIAKLGTQDRLDFLSMYKKHLFYLMSAEALLKSHSIVTDLEKELGI